MDKKFNSYEEFCENATASLMHYKDRHKMAFSESPIEGRCKSDRTESGCGSAFVDTKPLAVDWPPLKDGKTTVRLKEGGLTGGIILVDFVPVLPDDFSPQIKVHGDEIVIDLIFIGEGSSNAPPSCEIRLISHS